MAESFPDAWPPIGAETAKVPVFPLPGVFLFPGTLLPMHVFEPRYRQMIDDLLDQRGWLVISAIQAGHEDEAPESPPFYNVGGLGEIAGHNHLEDGRFLVTLHGIKRVRLREVESDKPYRMVEYEGIQESQPTGERAVAMTLALRQAINERSDEELEIPMDAPMAPLADLLLHFLKLPAEEMQAAFAEPDAGRRAHIALAKHIAT
jgi:Lon protease-like protein